MHLRLTAVPCHRVRQADHLQGQLALGQLPLCCLERIHVYMRALRSVYPRWGLQEHAACVHIPTQWSAQSFVPGAEGAGVFYRAWLETHQKVDAKQTK